MVDTPHPPMLVMVHGLVTRFDAEDLRGIDHGFVLPLRLSWVFLQRLVVSKRMRLLRPSRYPRGEQQLRERWDRCRAAEQAMRELDVRPSPWCNEAPEHQSTRALKFDTRR